MKILVSAGEASGDEHAAALLLALKKRFSDLEFRGMGGKKLRDAGLQTIVDSEASASVMGFGAVFKKLPQLLGILKTMKQELATWRPDLLIVIDFPDFNLRLAKCAKQHNIPVLYFIPPKLWAWRTGRVKIIKKYVDAVAAIFPHEEEFYRNHGYDHAHYVGHPFTSDPALKSATVEQKHELRRSLGLVADAPTLAILPGSRRSEIERHLALVIDTFKLLKIRVPDLQAVIPVPSSLDTQEIQRRVDGVTGLKVIQGDSVKVMRLADAGLLKSGTSNLQAAFCELPFVMFFVTSALSAWIVRRIVKIKEYSPVNIISAGTAQEIVQEEAIAEKLATAVLPLLADEQQRQKAIELQRQMMKKLVREGNAYEETAKLAARLRG